MAGLDSDRALVSARRPDFKALVVGLHWPSLPWGDESFAEASRGATLSAASDTDGEVDAFARRIADTPMARNAIRRILYAARDEPHTLSSQTLADYATLFTESGLGSGDVSGSPGSDQGAFDPEAIVADYKATQSPASSELLGWTDNVKDAVLSPLRQLSFWKMKDRARQFGETGAHALLATLQADAPAARFHLMGHSFGCIVVSATIAGGPGSAPLPRPVDSLFLVQGAFSLWSYANEIPYAPRTAGYFNRIVKQRLVRGPIVTTRSKFDTAVGRFYPLGAKVRQQLVLGGEAFPEYGGVGAFGLQGVASAEDAVMQGVGVVYPLRNGRIYNLEASAVIRNGDGASGAHSDIAHPEVAHAFWCAVVADGGSTLGDSSFLGQQQEQQQQIQMQGSPRLDEGVHPTPPPQVQRQQSDRADQDWFATGAVAGRMARAEPPIDGGLLGAETAATLEVAGTGPPPAAQRWINAEIEDHAKDVALTKGQWYVLAFDVDVVQRVDALAAARFLDDRLFEEGDDVIELTVQLAGEDFEIGDATRPLRVRRVGKSLGKARFDISPKHDGASSLTAAFHKKGNLIQQIDLKFDVGAAGATVLESVSLGRPLAAATVLFPRDVGLSIQPGVGGYDCMVWGPVAARARLPLQPAYLAGAIDIAREEIMKVVMYRDAAGAFVFQRSLDIPEGDRAAALRVMARAGATLFRKLFFGPDAADDSRKIGEYLRRMATEGSTRLKLQIMAHTTPVPWGLLYVGDASDGAALQWENFLGMRHVIEVIPLQNQLAVADSAIRSDPRLSVSINVNDTIDAQMHATYVADQKTFWGHAAESRKRVHVTDRTKGAELKRALADATTDDQILYFYCHAASKGLNDLGGPDASSIELSDAPITLGDLNLDAPTTIQLPGNPLVFINACESAELSAAFYDGFVPYFMAKGARGVVGTECKTPALFAATWAQRFFDRFLDGETLGDAFLALRQEFLNDHGNPLGLMYAVHCDGDTRIQPALKP